MEKQISWKPSGSLIAASRMTPVKHEIIFFEKNGLQHLSFKLPYEPKRFIVQDLVWSCESELFFVCGFQSNSSNDFKTYEMLQQNLLIYTQSNYYWYLKQKLNFSPSDYVENIICDENNYSLVHYVTSKGTYFSQNIRQVCQTASDGTVFIVDANQLQISDYKESLVPPPLCNYSIAFQNKHVQIHRIFYSKTLLSICTNEDILVIFRLCSEANFKQLSECQYPISYNFCNVSNNFSSAYVPIFFEKVSKISEIILPILLEDGHIFGIIGNQIVSFDYKNDKEIKFLCQTFHPIDAMAVLSDTELLVCNEFGQLSCFSTISNSFVDKIELANLDSHLCSFGCSQLWIYVDPQNKFHVISLTKNRSLYYDQILLMNSTVNSVFLYCNKYVLFSTIDNLFYCWPLVDFDLTNVKTHYPPRELERGAKIVSASCHDAKVVVQLPRGNLESFNPRCLVLNQVNELLNRLEFLKAFEILRKHRINLNYICDYNCQLFIDNCELFLIQLHQVDYICLFLFELSSENFYTKLNHLPEMQIINKLNSICKTLFEAMMQLDDIKFLKPILLTFVKKTTAEIGNALKQVKKYDDTKLQNEGVKFLSLIVNVNKLFDEALGTYDFDILLMVASKSNKDPKEYIALINSFMEIQDENYRKYKIDLHLQRYKSCLLHLSKCTDKIDEALKLIESRHLFREAIEIFELNNQLNSRAECQQIWNLYGEYLFQKKYYDEAAIAFKRAINYNQAFKMYTMSANWDLACVCARKVSINSEEFNKMIHSLAQQLKMNGKYIDSAYIMERYLNDYEQAFRTLVKGHEWTRAIRCKEDYSLEDSTFDDEFRSELMDTYDVLTETIDSNLRILIEHADRLKVLKETKENNNFSEFQLKQDFDAYSDTSSVLDTASISSGGSDSSANTLKTNRSNSRQKHLKRLEQKKYVLKKGSFNEDIQIVFALKELIVKCVNLFDDCVPLIKILYDHYYVDQSAKIQSKLDSLHRQLTFVVDFVWNSDYFEKRLSQGMKRFVVVLMKHLFFSL